MRAWAQVVAVEIRLIVRDPLSAFFALAFPVLVLGVKLRTGETLPAGRPLVDATVPMLSTFVLGLATLVVLPTTLARYRERQILKRLRATPAAPTMLLGAQWASHTLLAALGTVALIIVGAAAFGLHAPGSVLKVLLAWLLGALSLGAIGLLLGALLPTGGSANVVGLTVFFPMVFVSGVMIPREQMSDSMRAVGDLTPMAPVVQALRDGWAGEALSPVTLIVMAAITLLVGGVAVRAFRW